MKKNFVCLISVLSFCSMASSVIAITITSMNETGGPSAQQLAAIIVDTSDSLFLNTDANINIDSPTGVDISDKMSLGSFVNGITAPGTLLPTNNPNGDAVYAGGIGISLGICLCSGLVTDKEDFVTLADWGDGLEGPNNGFSGINAGEMNTILGTPTDVDFEAATGLIGSDASVLQFTVALSSPAYLRMSFVFGSDEVDAWLNQPFNDSFAIIIDSENIATININGNEVPFELQEIEKCNNVFIHADTAPSPQSLVTSAHAQAGELLYDIELGGFTTVLTRETEKVLAPGNYLVKIVVQDVSDDQIDAALFIPQDGFKARCFLPADFDLNGKVDGADFLILQQNWGSTNTCFEEGDAERWSCRQCRRWHFDSQPWQHWRSCRL